MLATVLALVAIGQAPKTFEELELAKIIAYRKQKNFREELELAAQGTTLKRSTLMDGLRIRTTTTLGDSSFDSYNDGVDSWVIMHKQKLYSGSKVGLAVVADPKKMILKAEQDSYQFKCDSGLPIQFASNPEPRLTSVETVTEGKEKLKKVVAVAEKGERRLTITQWFLEDKWLLKRFKVEGQGQDGPISFVGEVKVLDFKALVKDSDFFFDPSKLVGYSRINAGSQ